MWTNESSGHGQIGSNAHSALIRSGVEHSKLQVLLQSPWHMSQTTDSTSKQVIIYYYFIHMYKWFASAVQEKKYNGDISTRHSK